MEHSRWFIIKKRTNEVVSEMYYSFEEAMQEYDRLNGYKDTYNYTICQTVYN